MKKKLQKTMMRNFATTVIAINNRCNISCRHCVATQKEKPDALKANIISWIKQIAATKKTKKISFAGGEPFLCLDELIEYIKCAKEANLESTVITNGYWATSEEKADEILDKLSGIDNIIVSSDKYHLEFISKEIVDNVINVCIKRNVNVHINAAVASEKESEDIRRLYMNSHSKPKSITISPIFVGSFLRDIEVEKFNYMEQPHRLNNHCPVQNLNITSDGKVFACCGAANEHTSLLYFGNLTEEKYVDIIKRRDESLLYKFMDNYGPAGLVKVICKSHLKDDFIKTAFAQECHMCIWALKNKDFYSYLVNLLEKMDRKRKEKKKKLDKICLRCSTSLATH